MVVVVVVVVIAKEDFLLAEQCLFGAGASSMSDLLLMVHVEEAVVYTNFLTVGMVQNQGDILSNQIMGRLFFSVEPRLWNGINLLK